MGWASGFSAGANRRSADNQNALEQRKLMELVRKARIDEQREGFTGDGAMAEVNPEYYTPGTPAYQRSTRESELKALTHPSAAKSGLTAPIEMLNDPQAFAKSNPGYQVPSAFAGNFKRQSQTEGLASELQRKQYSEMFKIPFEATEGLKPSQMQSGVRYLRGQEAAGARQDKSLGQAAGISNRNYGFDVEKDIQNRVERFRDDYAKTGIPTALPAIQELDRLTGVLSSEKPNLKKVPGVGTNVARTVFGPNGASLAVKSYGGEKENQLIQRLLNSEIRTNSGQAVSRYEEGRNLLAAGMSASGSEEDVANGIRYMHEALQGADADVRAAYPPEVIARYEGRGGGTKLNPSALRAKGAKEKKSAAGAGKDSGASKSNVRKGMVLDGYQFQGGDAGDPKNWIKVK